TGRINISGRTGLLDRDYDQRVFVTPRMSATLPIAGTVVGGPVTGLAVLLAQTVVTKTVPETAKLGRVQYSVQGSWSDPVVERVKKTPDDNTDSVVDEQESEDLP
ncbi:MAG: YhdP family protein, partial [bacterium]